MLIVECDCDPTGSESSECDNYAGHCKCKENVIGRKCEQCAPGTYNFGPSGCSRKSFFVHLWLHLHKIYVLYILV